MTYGLKGNLKRMRKKNIGKKLGPDNNKKRSIIPKFKKKDKKK